MGHTRRTALSVLGAAAAGAMTAVAGARESSGPLRVSRERTLVGGPVALRGPEGVEWELTAQPPGSDTRVRDPTARTTTVRPDAPGRYVVTGVLDDGRRTVRFRAEERSGLIERYAPRLHFHPETEYRPTRIEAMLEHAELRRTDEPARYPPFPGGDYPRDRIEEDPHDGETVADPPTTFDLAGRDGSHYLYLPDDRERYPAYQEAYPPTLYASVTETTFRGEPYTAVVYWPFYVFDPKHGLAQFFEHQADLESMIVLVGEDGPEWFAAAQHGAGEFRRWAATPTDGTHPQVYIERGAHASMFRNSSRYDGDGFLIQGYYVGNDSPFSEDTETDPVLSLLHTDETGSAEVWSHDDACEVSYELVPLAGNEVWATYEGGFAAAPGSITGPHQRDQYEDPGGWIADRPYPDYEHVDATGEVYAATVEDGVLSATVGVKNWGPKPHPYWASIEAEPPDSDGTDARLLADERFRVGTDREAFARVDAGGRRAGNTEETRRELTVELPADYDDDWSLRLRVWSYPAGVRTEQDFHDEKRISPVAAPDVPGG